MIPRIQRLTRHAAAPGGMGALSMAAALAAVLLLGGAGTSRAATAYDQGETVAVTVGQIPAGYVTYWVSDQDGFLAQGDTLRTSTLTVGEHRLWALIYRSNQQVWSGYLDVEILAAAAAPSPTRPTPPAGSGSGSNTPALVAPGEFEEVSELLLGCPDAYMVEDLYPEFLEALRGVVPTTIYVDNDYVRYDLIDLFARAGVDDTDHALETMPLDTIWMRDYGPLFVKNQGTLEVVDLAYYPGRDYDDAVPRRFADREGYRVRPLPVAWEGGNFTADGLGNLFSTDQLEIANAYDYAPNDIERSVEQAFGGELHIFEQMANDGGTGHIDMFFLMTGPADVLLNRFPSGHRNYARMNRHATRLEGMGYRVTRLDLADRAYSSHSNGLLVNGVALVPLYGNGRTDAAALQAYRDAGYAPYGIDCSRIIQWAGAIHCITITVPR